MFGASDGWSQSDRRLEDLTITSNSDTLAGAERMTSSSVLISDKEIADLGIQTAAALDKRVPGLSVFGSTPRTTGFSVRGLGSNQINDGVGSSVGVYVDEVYQPRQSVAAFGLYDIDYIDVRKGPQGQSYGIGSTAGDILVRTKLPGSQRSTELSYAMGNMGYQSVMAAMTGPLIEGKLSGRLSFFNQVKDGSLQNQFDGSLLNNQNKLGVRGQLMWRTDQGGSVRLIGEYGLLDQRCCDYPLIGPVSRNIAASDAYMQYDRPGTNPYDRITSNDEPSRARQYQQYVSLIVERPWADRYLLKSITSLNNFSYKSRLGDDASLRLLSADFGTATRQLVQELRISAQFNRLKAVAGLFYTHQNLDGYEVGHLQDQIALWTFGGQLRQRSPALNQSNSGVLINTLLPPQTFDGLQVITPHAQRSDVLSAYVSNELALKPDTTLSFGVRTVSSQRSSDVSRRREGGNPNASPLAASNNLAPLGALLGQDLSGYTFNGLVDDLVGRNFQRNDHRSDLGVAGSLGLSRQLSPSVSTYAKVSTGFKSGGLNLTGTTAATPVQFKPERVAGVEAGVSWDIPRRGLLADLVIYRTNVRDFQAVSFDQGEGLIPVPRQSNIINIPQARLQGLELNMSYRTRPAWLVTTGLSYSQAISTEFTDASNEDTGKNDKNLSGKQLYNAPRWSGYVGLEKGFRRSGRTEWYAAVNGYFKSATFGAVEQSRNSFINAYQVVDLRLGARGLPSDWRIEAWVRNLFNEKYLSSVATVYGVSDYGAITGDRRSAGISTAITLNR